MIVQIREVVSRAMQFYGSHDDVLCRKRDEGSVPEVFDPKSKAWRSYPEMDPIHEFSPIDEQEAQRLAGAGASLR